MKVREVMTAEPLSCGRDDCLDKAADIMWNNDCGCVPVVDRDRVVVGIVTDRDACMAAYTTGEALTRIPVSTAMAHEVLTVGPDEPASAAERIMRDRQVRRLPVVDAEGRLIGVVSLNDLARASANTHGRLHPKDLEVVGSTLAAICQPRTCRVAPERAPLPAAAQPS